MKYNYILNDDNTIKMLTSEPINEAGLVIEIEDSYNVKLGLDKIINNKLVKFEGIDQKEVEFNKYARISALKKLLADSDYQAIKFSEGELSAEEYAPIKELRKSYRAEISKLEK